MADDPKLVVDGTALSAMVAAVRDLRGPKYNEVRPVSEDARIDGKTCLVTGATSGLGKAAAIELARRGGNMLLACRPGSEQKCEEIRQRSGSANVDVVEVDLADLNSVHRLCDNLKSRRIRIDIALMNAGLMLSKARKSPQGLDMMFAVHFLSSRVMIDRWLRDGVICPSDRPGKTPRIVFVASESHRSSHIIDFDGLGTFTKYGMRDSLKYYGISKLMLCTYASELSRRLNPVEEVNVAVHAMCPGGIASNIAREAPAPLRPIVNTVLRYYLQSPEQAMAPAMYLCCAAEAGSTTGMYLHLMQRKAVSASASDPENGARLWEASAALLRKLKTSA